MRTKRDCQPAASAEPGSVDPQLAEVARMWGSGWQRHFFPAFWLVYLGQTVDGVAKYQHALPGQVAGYAIVAVFAVLYLAALPMGWNGAGRWFWYLYVTGFALMGAELLFARNDALVFTVYLAVLTIAARHRVAPALIATLVVVTAVLPRFVASWGHKINWDGGWTVFLVAIAMTGFFKIIQSNIALGEARAEVARLAAENERSRIARDLHDLLGHSLTTITVKAGLARRLAERGDPVRAQQEISEVEQLSRRTLGDVRAAVAGHRDVTLAGELATSREVLRASGIQAELPGSVDVIDPRHSELFGWVLREGITNVVRHSRADHVAITLGPNWIEVADDGVGGSLGVGNGISGLRERVDAAGGTLSIRGGLVGWKLRVEMPLAQPSRTKAATSPVGVTVEAEAR